MAIQNLSSDPNILLSMPIPKLALEVLREVQGFTNIGAHNYSCSLDSQLVALTHSVRRQVIDRAMEAWSYLERQGYLAPDTTQGRDFKRLTDSARDLLNSSNPEQLIANAILPRELIHPSLLKTCYERYISADFQGAVDEACDRVERSVRDASGLEEKDGVKLMFAAFKSAEDSVRGPLTDTSRKLPEQKGEAHLFAGFYGFIRNPVAHKDVHIDQTTAGQLIAFASYLLCQVDIAKSERHLGS